MSNEGTEDLRGFYSGHPFSVWSNFSPVFLTWDPVGKKKLKTIVSSLIFSVCNIFFQEKKYWMCETEQGNDGRTFSSCVSKWKEKSQENSFLNFVSHIIKTYFSPENTFFVLRKHFYLLTKKTTFLLSVSPESCQENERKVLFLFFPQNICKIFLVKSWFSMFETEWVKQTFGRRKNTFNKGHFSNCVFFLKTPLGPQSEEHDYLHVVRGPNTFSLSSRGGLISLCTLNTRHICCV